MKKHLEHINRIDQLIRFKNTGTAEELAEKLAISRSTLFETLNLMKDFGAEIAYCPHRQTYYYTQEGRFEIGFKSKHPLSKEDMGKISGGNQIFLSLYKSLESSFALFATESRLLTISENRFLHF